MIRILFICHGNICRSPMAEFVTRDLAAWNGLSDMIYADSAATTEDEIWGNRGNPVYPPAREELKRHGIGTPQNELGVSEKRARLVREEDYDRYDLIIGMDRENLSDLRYIFHGDPEHRVRSMLDWTNHPRAVSDPWYTGDFSAAWRDISAGCIAMFRAMFPDRDIRVPVDYGV